MPETKAKHMRFRHCTLAAIERIQAAYCLRNATEAVVLAIAYVDVSKPTIVNAPRGRKITVLRPAPVDQKRKQKKSLE
jgi:hypothetical protein